MDGVGIMQADDDISGADADMQGAIERRLPDHFNPFAATESQRIQALRERLLGMNAVYNGSLPWF
jgi:hypothetical protein